LVYAGLERGLSKAVDDSLQLSAAQAIAAVNIENGAINFSDSIPEDSTFTDLRERGLTIRVLRPTGAVLQSFGSFRSMPVTTATVVAARQRRSTFETLRSPVQRDGVRFYTAPIVENERVVGVIQVARTLSGVRGPLDQLLTSLLISAPLLVGIAAFGGYKLAARALAPIEHITRTARRISAQDLHARLNLPPTDDEVGRLAATFDSMLTRLDTSFRRERQFTADASHELRTPLAAMQVILGVTRAAPRTACEYEQALDDLASQTERLRGLVEHLLQLARGDAQPVTPIERVDLSALLHDVSESLRPLAEAKGLALTSSAPAGLQVLGDSDGLIRLFVNLVDNGVKYTEHGSISVDALCVGDYVQVIVHDTGVGIDPERLPHVFDRFFRADPARSVQGAGLGLSIALDIVHAHKGTLEANSRPGHGTSFVVRLPNAS
jgi:signal transduction histidine kinase